MYRNSFPKCSIKGDQTPSRMLRHLDSEFAVPKKCLTCKFMFEGECSRALDQKEESLRLDTGSCGIQGSSKPYLIEKLLSGNELYVPEKCVKCKYLFNDKISKYVCTKDQELWGDTYRDLDWGNWEPDYPNVGIIQAIVSKEVIVLIQAGRKKDALLLYRKLNGIETIMEAKRDIDKLEIKINNALGENDSEEI